MKTETISKVETLEALRGMLGSSQFANEIVGEINEIPTIQDKLWNIYDEICEYLTDYEIAKENEDEMNPQTFLFWAEKLLENIKHEMEA